MKRIRAGRTFLGRLARDVRGNTIALMAAAMMPLAGLIGGGVDMSRIYLTKTRLQQACDAGALAGRKAMGAGSWTTGSATSTNGRAEAMFSANFIAGEYGTGTLTKNFTESNGIVTGVSTAVVPMTIMKVFGMSTRTIRVTCEARMEIPNTDVMFVLDVTGSMMCAAGQAMCFGAASPSKLDGLKGAIKCFYEALVKVNTAQVCGNDPTAVTATTTAQIRLGFVPYSVNVNVGKLLPNSYLANSWTYQSRTANFADVPVYSANTPTANGPYWEVYGSSISQTNCLSYMRNQDWDGNGGFSPTATSSGGPSPTATVATTFPHDNEATNGDEWSWSGAPDTGGTSRSCRRKRTDTTTTYTQTGTTQVFSGYTYQPRTFDVSGLKAGSSNWNGSINLPVGTQGASTAVTWDGCIEERQTYQNTNGSPQNDWATIPASAYDLNIDMVPSDLVANSKWGPMLSGATWGPYTAVSCSYFGCTYTRTATNADYTTSEDLDHNNNYSCPTAARKLTTYNTSSGLVSYVDSFSASGATYHDIGMIWGARLLSPTGLFAAENALTPSGRSIQRHLIFMTDGDTNTSDGDYGAYGLGFWSRRQTSYDPTDTQMDDMTNARLAALCTAVKNMNITLWVVSYGGNVNEATETRLNSCATPGRFYSAADNAALISRFRQIASEISELRLTR
jgi:Flp pilus assembly protein TadG